MSDQIHPRRRSVAAANTRASIAVAGIVLAAVAPAGVPAQTRDAAANRSVAAVAPEYRISPGDELSVTFPYNAELNHDGPVGPDGRFTLPQVGNIVLANATVDEATGTISAALRRLGIVENARPSLTIRQYGASVFVGGEVRNPGAVRLASGMDPLQAVIAAGGLLDTAKSKRIVIIRRGADGTPILRYVNLRDYLRHGVGTGIEPLHAQEVVFVPKSSIAEANVWVDQYINRLLPFSRSLNYSIGNGTVNTVPAR
ncbi:polysaccharide biosynthesis/export family protein [Sphingomonas faeni]|uniref:polysaccharide biosynthesis/export family protein n=1 Tax=Sphingomonas faeni TaxID=185950 RepID=UPI00335A0621